MLLADHIVVIFVTIASAISMQFKNTKHIVAGHREISDEKMFDNIVSTAEKLILTGKVNEFWVGNYGIFDILCEK